MKRFEIQYDARVRQIVEPGAVQLEVISGKDRERKTAALAAILGLPVPRLRGGEYRTQRRGGLQVWTRPEGSDR